MRTRTHRILSVILAGCLYTSFTAAQAASPWNQTAPLITARAGASIVGIDGVIYAIGGVDGTHFLNSSEYTRIQNDGSLAPWRAGSALNEERGFFGVAAYQGYVYAAGGGKDANGGTLLRSVERAPILGDGGLGPWQREEHELRLPRRCAKLVAMGGYLYALGGYSGALLASVERAPIHADGSLGEWALLEAPLTQPRYIHGAARTATHVYIAGGHAQQGGGGETAVEWRAMKDGEAWRSAAPLQHGRYGLSVVSHAARLYAMGGLSGATFYDVIETSAIGAGGAPGPWQKTTALPLPLADFGAVVAGEQLYLIGGTNQDGYYNTVYSARFDARGGLSAAAASPADTAAPAPVKRVQLEHAGVITQALDGGMYIYLEVDTGAGREWLAAANMALRTGERVRYSEGIMMRDFFSKHLQRRFDAIRFVGKLEKDSAE